MRVRLAFATLAFCASVSRVGSAQQPPQWGDLQGGRHAVGFRVMETVDHTRGYWPPVTHDGRRDTLETARPMQISIWYPAADSSGSRMAFGDYIAVEAEALGPERATPERRREAVESLRRGPLNPFFPGGVSDEDLRRVLATPTASVRDADAAEGPFPLIIHVGFGLPGQSVLLEYLASHGYVVASLPLLGTAPAWYHRGEGTPQAHQSGADDIGFAYAVVGALPFVDRSRAAVIGMISADGLLFQMQHQRLRALAVLDGGYPQTLRHVPGFDLDAVRIPILDMPRSGERPDRVMLDSLRYAERYRVRFDSVTHADFYQFRRIAHPQRASEHVSYRWIARYTLAFLDHALKQDRTAAEFLAENPESAGAPAGFLSIERQPANPAAPTTAEFLLLIREGALAEARRAWTAFRESDPPRPLVAEAPLTTTLLFLRRDRGAAASADAFRLLVEMFPESWRAREHLAATHEQADDAVAAAAAYRESLRLLRSAPMSDGERTQHERRLETRLAALRG